MGHNLVRLDDEQKQLNKLRWIFPTPVGADPAVDINSMTAYSTFVAALAKDMGDTVLDRLHAAVGISGEAGELLDAVKKNWAYNKPLDVENVAEELGDLLFYVQLLMILCNLDIDTILQMNVTKLQKRYPNGYSDAAAQLRADKLAEAAGVAPVLLDEVTGDYYKGVKGGTPTTP